MTGLRRLVVAIAVAGALAAGPLAAAAGPATGGAPHPAVAAAAAADPGNGAALGRAAGAANVPAAGMDPVTGASLDAALVQARKDLNTPGLSLAIRLADGTVWTSVTGRATLPPDTSTDVTADTAYSAGSITKTFVAALVMQQVDAGTLKLTDRLSHWLPGFPHATRIRLYELLQHTSGVPDYFANPNYESLVFGRPTHVWTEKEIVSLMKGPLLYQPGTRYHYSNSDFVLLGRVLERVTRKTLGALIRGRLLGPLGLDHSAFQDVEPTELTSAQGYLRENKTWVGWSDGSAYRPSTSAATVAWAAGAMLSTPADLVQWAHALYGGSVVSAASLAKMVTFNHHDYGLGTERFFTTADPTSAEPMWGHSGSLRGFEAQMWYIPSRHVTIVLMSNRGRRLLRPTVQQLLAVLFAGP